MPTVAEKLRASREAQALSIYQVADITKIKTDHVRALEEGNYSAFPAPVYIRGFVRTYAAVLKLPLPELMAALDAELQQSGRFPEPRHLSREPTGFLDVVMLQLSKVNWRVALPSLGAALALLIALFGYRAWRSHESKDPLSALSPGEYQEKQAGETLPLPAPQKR
jgi:cytoskeleton protein RodZ